MKDRRTNPSRAFAAGGDETLPAVGRSTRIQRKRAGGAEPPAFRPYAEQAPAEPVLIAHAHPMPVQRKPSSPVSDEWMEMGERAKQMDPAGDEDRERARAELAKKLTIIDEDFDGERLPNMVTQREFEEVVRMYSDIRLGRADLKLDAGKSKDPEKFERDMMDDLGDILQTVSGRELIGGLADNTTVDDDGNEIHHTTTLFPHLDENGDPGTGAWTMAHGDGAAVVMNPNQDLGSGDAAMRSDVALYHELVHAHHITAGTRAEGVVEASDAQTHAMNRGDLFGIARELVKPDPRIAADAVESDTGAIARDEHQASGLGLHADDRLTENAYRAERRGVARSGQGLAGDRHMPTRKGYRGDAGTAHHKEEKKGKKRKKGRKGKKRT